MLKKNIFLLFIFLFISTITKGITYYSVSGLVPNLTTSWKTNRDGSGTSPVNFTSGDVFIIQGSALAPGGVAHALTTSAIWSISGVGSKLWIESGAILTANHQITIDLLTTWQIDAGGKYIHNHTTSSPQTTTFAGTESFNDEATIEFKVLPSTNYVFIECFKACTNGFPNIIWNMAANDATNYIWDSDGSSTFTFRGDLTISSTGTGKVVMISNENDNYILQGDFIISSGLVEFHRDASSSNASLSVYGNMQLHNNASFDFSPNGSTSSITFNLKGNFTNNASGYFKSTNLPIIWNFNGTGSTQVYDMSSSNYNSTNFIDWTIASAAVVQLASDLVLPATSTSVDQFVCNGTLIFGTGSTDGSTSFNVEISTASSDAGDNFTLAANATLKITSVDGILPSSTAGNIRVGWNNSGRISLSSSANYYYVGSSAQVTGIGLPSTVKDFGINTTTSSAVSLSSNLIVSGTCYMTKGSLNLNTKVLSYGISGALCYNSSSATQTTADAEFPVTGGPVKLIINNTFTNQNVTLHADRTLSASDTALSLRNGKLLLSGKDLTLSGTNVQIGGSNFSDTKMIVTGTGYLIRVFGSGNSNAFTYPIGATNKYSPVTLDFSTASANMTIGLRVSGTDYSQNTADNRISRYWTYSFSGATTYSYTATYSYATVNDVVGNEASLKLAYYANNDWNIISGSSAGSFMISSGSLNQTTGPLTTGYVYTGRHNTISAEPNSYPSAFTASGASSSTIRLDFSAASTINNTFGYLILRRQDGTFPTASNINDGTAPTALTLPSGTTLVANINSVSTSLYLDNGLTAQTIYHYAIIPYNFENSLYNYRTTATVPSDSAVTSVIASNMTFTSCTTTQPAAFTRLVGQNTFDNGIIRMNVVVSGSDNPISVTAFTFNTNGSTNVADISNAKLYYVGTSTSTNLKTISKTQFGSTVLNPNGTFTINDGVQLLQPGTNYFILTYSISPTATLEHLVDAQCTSITVGGIARTPNAQNPSGDRMIANSWGGGTIGNTTNWSTSTNWSSSTIPGNSGNAFISGGLSYYPVLSVTDTLKNIIIESGATLTINSGNSLKVSGDLNCEGNINASGANITLYGANNQSLIGNGLNFSTLIINKSAATIVTMGDDVSCANNLTLTSGILNISDYTLSTADIASTSGILNGGTTSNVTVTGTSNLPEITNGINNLTIVAGTTTLTGNNLVTGILTLGANTLNIGNFSFKIKGSSPTKLIGGNIIATSGKIEFENNTLITLPTQLFSSSSIQHLIMNGVGGITLSDDVNLTGNLELINGTINSNGKKIIISGNSITKNNGLIDLSNSSSEIEFTHSGIINLPAFALSNNINKLILNTSGSLNLGSPYNVTGNLTLTNGLLILGANNLTLGGNLIGGSSSSYVFTNSSGNFIIANVNKNTNYTFPIGNTGYTPAVIRFANQGTFTNVSVSSNVAISSEGIPTMNPVNAYHINRFWTIEPSGTLSGYSYDIDLTYLESDINGSGTETTLMPVKKSDEQWYKPIGSSFTDGIEQGSGSINSVANLLTWSGLSTFSKFGATGNAINPLPVELISFSSACNNGVVELNWKTISEKNTLKFVLQKSTDALSWVDVKEVKAAGNSNALLNYQITDYNDLKDQMYYRIKMIDNDGKFKLTNVIAANCIVSKTNFSTYPNPSNSNSSIFLFQTIKNDVKVLHVTIYNSEGREVFSTENLIENNNYQYAISTELSPGIYLFKLLDANNKVHLLKHVVID